MEVKEEVFLDLSIVKEEYSIAEVKTEPKDGQETVQFVIEEISEEEPKDFPCSQSCTCTICKKLNVKHQSEKSLSCEICGQSFKLSVNLKSHMKSHDIQSPLSFSCSQCGSEFSSAKALSSHVARHSASMNCKICKQTFKNRFTHRRHLKTHSAEKKFECKSCGRKFREGSSLKRHIFLLHEKVQEKDDTKVFKCSYCSLETVGKIKHKMHLLTHTRVTNVECSKCRKRFNLQKIFYMPMRNESDKPYICYGCDMAVKSKEEHKESQLKRAEHPKICFHCDQTFYNAQSFKNHVQEAHQDVFGEETQQDAQRGSDLVNLIKIEVKEEDSS
ncbi:zinc finger protein 878-like [Phlebotomus argentipes]|uniref:zinc finger protein 878-like n=1 Tax=Phlebotomus argentipes TaxID=94469 RepID=UPI002892C61C|nr:zinc finger protein 878-like [Phlebotomus argentipes]